MASNIEELDQGGGGPKIINSFGGQSLHDQSHGIQDKKLEDTNHFQIMKQFLNDPKRMLHHLLESEVEF